MRCLEEFKEGEACKSSLKRIPLCALTVGHHWSKFRCMASQSCPAWLPPSSFVSPGLTVFQPCTLTPSLFFARGLGSGIYFFLKCLFLRLYSLLLCLQRGPSWLQLLITPVLPRWNLSPSVTTFDLLLAFPHWNVRSFLSCLLLYVQSLPSTRYAVSVLGTCWPDRWVLRGWTEQLLGEEHPLLVTGQGSHKGMCYVGLLFPPTFNKLQGVSVSLGCSNKIC